jgi:2-dehydro-3-deoxygluconokinase
MTDSSAPEVVCIGEPLVAFVGSGQEALDIVPRFTPHVVGAELNVAVGLSRLGTRVAFVGLRGADALGDRIERALRAESVGVTYLGKNGRPTGVLFRSVRPFGVSEVVYARDQSAGSKLGVSDVKAAEELIAGAQWLHVSGVTSAISESAAEAVCAAFSSARKNGTSISFDVNLRERIRPVEEQQALLLDLAAGADLVLCGEDEGERLTNESEACLLAERFKQAGASMAVVKRGAEGALAIDSKGRVSNSPARKVSQVVDPVGAGDAFAAGLLADLISGLPLSEALHGAVTCAAYALTARGDNEGLPRPDELAAARRAQPTNILR